MKTIWFYLTLLLPIIIFLVFQNAFIIEDITPEIEKKLSFLSWVAGASVSFMAFGVLFLTIILDKKIFNNTAKIDNFFKPYHLEKKDLVQIINTYIEKNDISGLKWFYYTLSSLICMLNIFWAMGISFYADYSLAFIDLKLLNNYEVILDLLVLLLPFFFWLSTNLVSLFILNIIDGKSMSKNSVLIKPKNLLNITFLKKQGKADIKEIFSKVGSSLEIYPNDNEKIVYLKDIVPFTDYVLVLFLYSMTGELCYKIYFKNNDVQPKNMYPLDTLNKEIYRFLLGECKCELHLFDLKGDRISKYLLSKEQVNADLIVYQISRALYLNGESKNLEINNIKKLKDLEVKFEKCL